jgi:leader peptidase (prepilin peptidase)/N-methyltransferase
VLAVRLVVVSGLIVATFVDFACYEIPDEVSIGGIVLAPVASLLLPGLHEATWVARLFDEGGELTRAGALAGSLAGILVGGGVLLAIGWLGKRLYGREAMGLGDVKLLGRRSFGRSLSAARVAGRYVPFGPYLALGIGLVLLYGDGIRRWFF